MLLMNCRVFVRRYLIRRTEVLGIPGFQKGTATSHSGNRTNAVYKEFYAKLDQSPVQP